MAVGVRYSKFWCVCEGPGNPTVLLGRLQEVLEDIYRQKAECCFSLCASLVGRVDVRFLVVHQQVNRLCI